MSGYTVLPKNDIVTHRKSSCSRRLLSAPVLVLNERKMLCFLYEVSAPKECFLYTTEATGRTTIVSHLFHKLFKTLESRVEA